MTTYATEAPARRAAATSEPDVLVVGAGPAGLSAAAELGRLGVPAAILERSDAVASSWRGRYDRLRLNSPRLTSALPGSRFPKGTAQFPSRDQVVGYLESYAGRHGLDVRFGVRLDRIDPGDDGWHLTTSAGRLTAREVVIATGFAHTPRLPGWPGRERFPGRRPAVRRTSVLGAWLFQIGDAETSMPAVPATASTCLNARPVADHGRL